METEESVPQCPLTAGDIARRVFSLLLPVGVFITAVANSIEIETLLVGFPICSVLGLAFACLVTPMRAWGVLVFGLSAPSMAACCGMTIGLLHLSKQEAQLPISTMWWCYVAALSIFSVPVLARLWSWRRREHPHQRTKWQFSIRHALAVTTFVAVLFAIVGSVDARPTDFAVFAYSSLVVLVLVAGVVLVFIASRGQAEATTDKASSTLADAAPRG